MTINASDDALRTAAAAWERARLFDDKLGAPDAGRVAVWAESISRWNLEAPDVLQGVTRYYEGERNGRTMQIGDLLFHARELRRERGEREKAREIIDAPALPNPAAGGLPIPTEGTPVWAAYEINGAINRDCPRCDAKPDEVCIVPGTEHTLKIPCLDRMVHKKIKHAKAGQ